jgi:hypothetical protein
VAFLKHKGAKGVEVVFAFGMAFLRCKGTKVAKVVFAFGMAFLRCKKVKFFILLIFLIIRIKKLSLRSLSGDDNSLNW